MSDTVDRLILGNRRYSSWSMRGWLAVRLAGLAVEDVVVPLGEHATPALAALTPAGLVPALHHDGVVVWDSLAIAEYCAETMPSLWPADRPIRCLARSVAAEMHAGFRALRIAMPMNLGRTAPAGAIAADVRADIVRVEQIWASCRALSGSAYLFGADLTIPDVMFAPVVARFLSYQPGLSDESGVYCAAIRNHPLVDRWYRLAADEPLAWRLAKYE